MQIQPAKIGDKITEYKYVEQYSDYNYYMHAFLHTNLGSADVAGSLFASDVSFAGLKSEAVGQVAVRILNMAWYY